LLKIVLEITSCFYNPWSYSKCICRICKHKQQE